MLNIVVIVNTLTYVWGILEITHTHTYNISFQNQNVDAILTMAYQHLLFISHFIDIRLHSGIWAANQ